jgi:Fe-S-cluster-containing dehydrogenase component/anaerobic selenocysteine-containing dehydrogenase
VANLNRRDFLKALGVTGSASALSACGLDQNMYATPVENVLPYVVKPDQVTPGTYTFFATTVTRGPHALPVTARHRDGRVTFISANFGVKGARPPTGPAVPAPALYELQKHYNPDRIGAPGQGGPKAWDDGLAKLSGEVQAAVGAGKKVAYLGGYKSGSIVELLQAFTNGNAVFWEPAGYGTLAKAAELLFGSRTLPFYAVDKATYVLSFGAPFLGGWGDADIDHRYAQARNPNIGHSVVRFAAVMPARDQTSANADDFFACTPGSEATVARAIAKLVAADKGASDAIKALIGDVSVDAAAKASGLSAEQITSIAKNFAAGKSVALPGGATSTTDLAAASMLLNLAASADGSLFRLAGYAGPVHDLSHVEALIADMKAGNVGVLLLDDTDPLYALPAKFGFAEAAKACKLVVSLSSSPSATVKAAGLNLPTSDMLEDWGDEHPFAGLSLIRQPAMSPRGDTRSLGDVLLAVARSAGLTTTSALGFGQQTWRDYVAAWWQANVYKPEDGSFGDFWERSLVHGFVTREVLPTAPVLTATSYAFAETPLGGSGSYNLFVQTHPHRGDGRYANQPWAQEIGDPLTGQVWGSWLEVSEALAAELGLKLDDKVELSTESGKVELGVVVLPGMAKETVVLALGQGHTDSGRYASYGVNAFSLLSGAKDGAGATYVLPTKANLQKAAGTAGLVSTFSPYSMSDESRHFGVHVSAEKLAKVGDAATDHVGELTGIHGLELDARLRDRKISDFYGLPDHPTYRFGLTVDINACTGCSSCQVACYAENNISIVGPKKIAMGREMTWLRINRYWERGVGGQDDIRFVPMMCQQCGHAGCENVCPVLATYHNLDGLNAMVYNRCVGTRYCANACPFSVRRFNFNSYLWPESFKAMLNPDVTARQVGVMEKCTFCVQRLRSTKAAYKDGGNFTRAVPHEVWESVPACVEACPSQALTFGNLKDEESKVSSAKRSPRAYWPLEDLNVFSAVTYLAKASFHDDPSAHHGGGHGGASHEAKGEAGGAAAGGHAAEPAKGHEATGH